MNPSFFFWAIDCNDEMPRCDAETENPVRRGELGNHNVVASWPRATHGVRLGADVLFFVTVRGARQSLAVIRRIRKTFQEPLATHKYSSTTFHWQAIRIILRLLTSLIDFSAINRESTKHFLKEILILVDIDLNWVEIMRLRYACPCFSNVLKLELYFPTWSLFITT